jgi:hypothetical protein
MSVWRGLEVAVDVPDQGAYKLPLVVQLSSSKSGKGVRIMSSNKSTDNVKFEGDDGGANAAMRDCVDFTFTTRGGDLCISYSGVEEGEEYEIIIQGKGCKSVQNCRIIDGRWECTKK